MDEVGIEAEPPRRIDADAAVLWLGLGATVALSIWMTWGIWSAGMPAGDDTAAHVVRAGYAMEQFFGSGSIDGWQSSFGLGYQQFLFLGPGFSVLVAAIEVASFGMLSTLTATKVATVVSFALVPLSLAFVAWAFGLGRRVAGVASVLALATSSVFGGSGLAAIFGSGLLPNHLGSALLGFAFGGVVLVLRRPSVRRVVFTSFAAAALVATHPIAAIVLAFLSVAVVLAAGTEWFVVHARLLGDRLGPWLDRVAPPSGSTPATGATATDPTPAGADDGPPPSAPTGVDLRSLLGPVVARVSDLAIAGILAIGLAGFVLVPLVAHRNLRGENSAWADVPLGPRLLEIWRGTFLYRPWVALFVVLGFVFVALLALGRRRGALTVILTPVLYLAMARAFIAAAPDNIVAIQLTNRSVATVGLLCLLPLATLVSVPRAVVSRVVRAGDGPRSANPVTVLANGAVPIALAVLVVVVPPGLDRARATVVTPTARFAALADALPAIVPDGARFATQRLPAAEPSLTGMTHPDLWLAWATGANTLNIYNLESSAVFEPVYEAEHLTDRPPDEAARRLARLGVSHLVLIDVGEAPDLLRSPSFTPVWQQGSMAVLAIEAPIGQPPPASLVSAPVPLDARLTRADPQHLVIDASTSEATTATIAVGWSPKWQGTVDGVAVPTQRSTDNLVQIQLPGGPTTVALDFGPDGADLVGRALTAASLACAVGALLVDRRARTPRRRRRADPGDDTGPTADDLVSDAATRATMGR